VVEEVTVKLQRVTGLKVDDKTYYRWQVTIPAAVVEKMGWSQGDLVGVTARKDGVLLRRRILSPG
jgi:AbrB family looped-hinge helix DNA binding protein